MIDIDRQRLVSTFIDLVKISSPSWKELPVIEYIEDRVKKIGIKAERHPCGDSYNLLIRLDGTRKGIPVLFSCHTDTVVPCEGVTPVITSTRISSNGETVLGADDKAAVAAFLEVISHLQENNVQHGPLEFLFSCAEELGLYGIKGFDLSILKSKYAFVFDSGGSVGKIILKAPYHLTYRVLVKGKPAHAGMEPEKGINAIRVLSEIISAIPHGRIDRETTANVGIIAGGRAANIVAENAEMVMEARSISRKKLDSLDKKISAVITERGAKHGARVKIERNLEYSGFSLGANDKVVRIATDALKSLKMLPEYTVSGGGSDTNIINKAGIQAVNLSVGMRNVHTKREYIMIKDLINGAKLVRALIDQV